MHSATIPLAAMATFAAVYWLAPAPAAVDAAQPVRIAEAPPSVARGQTRLDAREAAPGSEVYYPGCNAVRAAGRAPLYRGQPGYRTAMDGDGDGIACETYRGGRRGR